MGAPALFSALAAVYDRPAEDSIRSREPV